MADFKKCEMKFSFGDITNSRKLIDPLNEVKYQNTKMPLDSPFIGNGKDGNNNEIETKKPIVHNVIDIDDAKLLADDLMRRKKKRKISTLDLLLPQVEAKKRKEEEENKRKREKHFLQDKKPFDEKTIKADKSNKDDVMLCNGKQLTNKVNDHKEKTQEKSALNDLIHFVGKKSNPLLKVEKPSSIVDRAHFRSRSMSNSHIPTSHDLKSKNDSNLYYNHTKYTDNILFSNGPKPSQMATNFSKKRNKRTISTNQRYSTLSNAQLQRRLVANARERSRVHALSNAFDSLRATIPSYSTEQKLSKLTILKVAINYIKALDQILTIDSNGSSPQRFETYVSECSRILQTEYGRSKTKLSFE